MTLQEAVTALKVHARQIEAIQTIAAAIGKVEDIDRLTQEAEQRRAARQAEVDNAQAMLAKVEKSIDAATSKLVDLDGKGQLIVDSAKDRAEAIKLAAQQEASALIKAAQAEAIEAAKSAREDATKLQAKVDDLSKQLVATDAELQAKGALLDDIEAKLAKARDSVARIVGA